MGSATLVLCHTYHIGLLITLNYSY